MKGLIMNLKLMAGVAAVLVMFAAVPVVYGGVSWTGIDPIFIVNGHQFNVWIEWPSQYDCDIEEIEVTVRVSADMYYEFVSESSEDLGCGSLTSTNTKVKFDDNGDNKVKVKGEVESDETFPVVVKVYLDGELVRTYEGDSDDDVTGEPIAVPQ